MSKKIFFSCQKGFFLHFCALHVKRFFLSQTQFFFEPTPLATHYNNCTLMKDNIFFSTCVDTFVQPEPAISPESFQVIAIVCRLSAMHLAQVVNVKLDSELQVSLLDSNHRADDVEDAVQRCPRPPKPKCPTSFLVSQYPTPLPLAHNLLSSLSWPSRYWPVAIHGIPPKT